MGISRELLLKVIFVVLLFVAMFFWFRYQGFSAYVFEPQKREKPVEVVESSESTQSVVVAESTASVQETFREKVTLTPVIPSKSQKGLVAAFCKKFNKVESSVEVIVTMEEGDFIKGTVDFDKWGFPVVFYAAKTKDVWVIASVENGVPQCGDINPYRFPISMVSTCYSSSVGTVISR